MKYPSVSHAVKAAENRADGVPHSPEHHNYHYNSGNQVNGNDDNDRPVGSPSLTATHSDSYNNGAPRRYERGKGGIHISRIVSNDPGMQQAIKEWGAFPGSLVNHCKRLGLQKVRESIQYVHQLSDAYFDMSRPVGPQRGAYLGEILRNGGLCPREMEA